MSEMDSDELYNRQARGALRHRPISTGAVVAMTEQSQPQPRIQRASRMRHTTTDETRQVQEPLKETTEIFQPAPIESITATRPEPSQESKHRSPILRRCQSLPQSTRMVGIFIASIIITLIVVVIYQQIAHLVTIAWDDLHYGRPRTFQTDEFVGHEGTGKTPSHFIAVNLHGHIEILELSGGDVARLQVYSGPQLSGPNADLIPPILQFVDTNQGRNKDMILRVGEIQVAFHNIENTFRLG